MGSMEFMDEAMRTTEMAGTTELLEQRANLELQLETARDAGNEESVSYLSGELAELDKQLATAERAVDASGKGSQEISFGAAYSEDYYKDRAAAEYAKNGESSEYRSLMKKAGEAHIENR